MKILLYDMGAYTQNDIASALDKMQIAYKNVLYHLFDIENDPYFTKRINELLDQDTYDAILSVNYFPVLSEICYVRKIKYLSWSYDSPLNLEMMKSTIGYHTNHIFLFDYAECRKLQKLGYNNVFHLPLAVNVDRLDTIRISEKDREKYGADISMVGQLYDSVLPLLMMPLSDYEKGYLTAVTEAQLKINGVYFLENVISEKLVEKMNAVYHSLGQCNLMLTREGLINTIAKQITHTERTVLLDVLSERFKVHLYGPDKGEMLHKNIWYGSAGYFDEMPRIFKLSKINLNVSLKSIQSGIPLRALDIMGCGGFLLTNYQQEIAASFVDGEEVVMYNSIEDAVAKCEYYMEHEIERLQIAEKGYQKVRKLFGYENRLLTIFRIAGLPV